jgi:hypothetical protein
MVDVLYRAAGSSEVRPVLDRATEREVLSVWMPVLAATDLLIQKLAVLSERYCDLSAVVPTARALREQVDWDLVRESVAGSVYAEITLELLERLDVIPLAGGAGASGAGDPGE